MQTIETKYIGPSNKRGSLITAVASGNPRSRVVISYNCTLRSEDAHIEAAKTLMHKMGWEGTMIGGHTKAGMVFVFEERDYKFTVGRQTGDAGKLETIKETLEWASKQDSQDQKRAIEDLISLINNK